MKRMCFLPLMAAFSLAAQTVPSAHPTIVIPAQPAKSKPTGIFPAQMKTAYGFNLVSNKGKGQIIGIVDAYDDPNIESDLGVFTKQFSLPGLHYGKRLLPKNLCYRNGAQEEFQLGHRDLARRGMVARHRAASQDHAGGSFRPDQCGVVSSRGRGRAERRDHRVDELGDR